MVEQIEGKLGVLIAVMRVTCGHICNTFRAD